MYQIKRILTIVAIVACTAVQQVQGASKLDNNSDSGWCAWGTVAGHLDVPAQICVHSTSDDGNDPDLHRLVQSNNY
jgi:hypothetical protein